MIKQLQSFFFQPISNQKFERVLTISGHLFFLTFVLFSILFYKERLINFDSSYFTFHLLVKEDFYVLHSRNVSYFSQILTLLVIKLGWSLKAVMIFYSFSFMLFYYLCFLIVRYGFKNPYAGIFLALSLCLTFRYKYYTAISEITASLGILTLVIGWLSKDWKVIVPVIAIPGSGDKPSFSQRLQKLGILNLRYWLIGLALLVLLTFTVHKFTFIPLILYFGYEFFFNHQWKNRGFLSLLLAFAGVLILSFAIVESGSYEEEQLGRLGDAWTVLSNLKNYEVWNIFKWYFRTEYAFPGLVFLAGLVWLFFQKKWFQATCFLLANLALGALVLVHNSYINGKVLFMIDGYLGYFGVLWALFFYLYFLKTYKNRFVLYLTIVLILFGTHRIYKKHEFYSQRLEYYQQIIDENATPNQRKFIFHKDQFSWSKMWMQNTLPYESLLYSAIQSPDSAIHVVIGYGEKTIERSKKRTDSLIATGKVEDMPERYFRFGNEGYVELKDMPWND